MPLGNTSTFAASCSAGMEKLVENEILLFGGRDIGSARGVVHWRGTLATAYQACLWSRYASRVLLKITSFTISDFDTLYEKCKKINWSDHLNSKVSFAVSCTLSEDSVLNHSHYASLRVKDAVVDQFVEQGMERPFIEKERPGVRVNVYVQGDRADINIDLSGESLHRRGYRDSSGVAPLKETLAAAIVTLSGWNGAVSPDTAFLDPMCGSGTLLIEAALIFGDSAPGLSRRYFGFQKWLGHNPELWSGLVKNAVEREESGEKRQWPVIIGYDADPVMVAVARKNIEKAGLENWIQVKCQEIARLKKPSQKGYLVSNLPYGERLSEKEEVKYLYRGVGRILNTHFKNWKTALFLSQPDLIDVFNLTQKINHKLYNGPISCRLCVGSVNQKEIPSFQWEMATTTPTGEGVDFANRLRKNFKKIHAWSKKKQISCFRVYDRDLPDYNVVIDIYERWVLVQEFSPPSTVEKKVAEDRFALVLEHVKNILNVKRDNLFIKRRRRQKGKEQYQKRKKSNRFRVACEGECFFLVNFIDYLDNGLFLDHRPIRKRISQIAPGRRFLNLFGYTGTATVHAALGGATLTTTVDLSPNYLKWARMNLALNGLSLVNNEIVQGDCISWLEGVDNTYDLIFVDPPTFSNTKKKGRVFDIQKDHLGLIQLAMARLSKDGLLIFSTNFRKFHLDKKLEEMFLVKDVGLETIPFDFQRNKSIHKCWEMQRR